MKYLLAVGVLLLTPVAPLWAEPTNVSSVNWFVPSFAAAPASRTGFLPPTLAVPVHGTSPRLVVTPTALRVTLPMRLTPTTGQAQATPKSQKSWFGRNWWWVVPVALVLTFVAVCADQGANRCGMA